jgi:hypothetical protein
MYTPYSSGWAPIPPPPKVGSKNELMVTGTADDPMTQSKTRGPGSGDPATGKNTAFEDWHTPEKRGPASSWPWSVTWLPTPNLWICTLLTEKVAAAGDPATSRKPAKETNEYVTTSEVGVPDIEMPVAWTTPPVPLGGVDADADCTPQPIVAAAKPIPAATLSTRFNLRPPGLIEQGISYSSVFVRTQLHPTQNAWNRTYQVTDLERFG